VRKDFLEFSRRATKNGAGSCCASEARGVTAGGGVEWRAVKRWLFTILAATSLLLFLAACALWVKRHFSADVISFANKPEPLVVTEWFVRSNFGILYFARNDHKADDMEPRSLAWASHEPYRGFCGPAVQTRSPCFVVGPFSLGGADAPTRSHSAFTLPHWFLAGVAAIAPLVWL
jgi:hypothetical protein